MRDSMMALEQRRADFESNPECTTARHYAEALLEAWSNEEIGRDTLRNGFIAIGQNLTGGLCDLGSPVKVSVV